MENTIVEKQKDDKLADLVKLYNEHEREAWDLLVKIFYRVKKNPGYKKISFSSGELLTNCWTTDRADLERTLFLHKFERQITDIIGGE